MLKTRFLISGSFFFSQSSPPIRRLSFLLFSSPVFFFFVFLSDDCPFGVFFFFGFAPKPSVARYKSVFTLPFFSASLFLFPLHSLRFSPLLFAFHRIPRAETHSFSVVRRGCVSPLYCQTESHFPGPPGPPFPPLLQSTSSRCATFLLWMGGPSLSLP